MKVPFRSMLENTVRQALPLVVACAIVLAGRASLADHYVVPTGSMRPTVEAGDRVIVNKLAYGVRVPMTERWLVRYAAPKVGEVVVLDSPEGGTVLLKRVAAAPGDTVVVVEGRIVLNGKPADVRGSADAVVEELNGVTHRIRLTWGGGPAYGPAVVPEGMYLLMGDNRGDSHDGRSFGLVRGEAILGRAGKIYFSGGGFAWRDL